MIDLHCHILPGLDDGALDLEDGIGMALQARDDGIDVVCATPHIRHDHDVDIARIASRVSEFERQLAERGIGLRVLPGGEVAQTAADGLTAEELSRACRSAEPGAGSCSSRLRGRSATISPALVDRLARRGARTVLAHPERHAGADLRAAPAGAGRAGLPDPMDRRVRR